MSTETQPFDAVAVYHQLIAEYRRLGYDEPRTQLIADLWTERKRRIENGEYDVFAGWLKSADLI